MHRCFVGALLILPNAWACANGAGDWHAVGSGFYPLPSAVNSPEVIGTTESGNRIDVSVNYRVKPRWLVRLGYLESADLDPFEPTYSVPNLSPFSVPQEDSYLLGEGVTLGTNYAFWQVDAWSLYADVGLLIWQNTGVGVSDLNNLTPSSANHPQTEREGVELSFGLGVQYQLSEQFTGYAGAQRVQLEEDIDEFKLGVIYHF